MAKSYGNGAGVPESPQLLIWLALMFVPGLYILMSLCALLALAVGGGAMYVLYQMFQGGYRVPARLIALGVFAAFGALLACIAVAKGAIMTIWRRPEFEPGMLLELRNEPDLGYFLAGLCSRMDTRLPNAVILHAEPTFYVTQGRICVFDGMATGRILAIGLPFLAALTQNEFRAVIAHEFGHFTGRDTVYSSRVLPVYLGSITAYQHMSATMDQSGSFWMRLPMMVPRLALLAYVSIFHRLDMHISRHSEIRADAVSATTCGSASFASGLKKVAALSRALCDPSCEQILRKSPTADTCQSYYTALRTAMPELRPLALKHLDTALAEKGSKHDTHPTLSARLSQVPTVEERFNDNAAASALFKNLRDYEKNLSEKRDALIALSRAR